RLARRPTRRTEHRDDARAAWRRARGSQPRRARRPPGDQRNGRRASCLPQRTAYNSLMQKITPFLWFNDNAEEAVNFYKSVFKNAKIGKMARYGDAGP